MATTRQPWSTRDDYTAASLLVIVLATVFGLFMLWSYDHQWIAWGFAMFAHWQVKFLELFTNRYDELDETLAHANYYTVTIRQIWHVETVLASAVSTPACILLGLLAIPCYRYAAPSRFTRRFDLSGLIREQARSFPAIRVAAGRELRLVRPAAAVRPLDPALTAAEWVERYAPGVGASAEDAMRAELTRQVGPLWQGPEHAAPIERILFLAFALHLGGDRKRAQELLATLSTEMGTVGSDGANGPDGPVQVPAGVIEQADRELADLDTTRAREIASRHAYTNTVLMSVLNEARRKNGVLPPSAFLATKLVDRRLWFALHSLGFPGDGPGQNVHPNPRVDAAGSRAHWQAECLARRPIILPHIDAAVAAIRTELERVGSRARARGDAP